MLNPGVLAAQAPAGNGQTLAQWPEALAADLATADRQLKQTAQDLGLPPRQIGNHGDRVRVASDIYNALLRNKDTQGVAALLQTLEPLGKQAGLNFGLKHPRGTNGMSDTTLNADAFRALDAKQQKLNEDLLNEWKRSRSPAEKKTPPPKTEQAPLPTAKPSTFDVARVMKELGDVDKRGNFTRQHVEQALEGDSLSAREGQALQELLDAGGKKFFFFNAGVEKWEPALLAQGLQVWHELPPAPTVDTSKLDAEALLERLNQDGDASFITLHEVHAALDNDKLSAPERHVLRVLLHEGLFKTGVLGWGTQYVQQKLGSLIDSPEARVKL